MKKFVTFLTIMSMVIGCFGATNKNHVLTDKFVDALIRVESNGRDNAIGDNGKAVGCLQIWKVTVDDVNQVSKKKYSYSDRKNRAKSIEICKAYLNRWGNHYQRKTGKVPTQEVYARIWNGGPNGHNNANTNKYWKKVRAYL